MNSSNTNRTAHLLMDITDADAVHQAAQKVGSMFGDKFPTFDIRNDNVIRRELVPL